MPVFKLLWKHEISTVYKKKIKQKFGGFIWLKPDATWLRFRLHDKQGILLIINAINGLIRNPVRILHLGKICGKYNIN